MKFTICCEIIFSSRSIINQFEKKKLGRLLHSSGKLSQHLATLKMLNPIYEFHLSSLCSILFHFLHNESDFTDLSQNHFVPVHKTSFRCLYAILLAHRFTSVFILMKI